MRLQSLSMMGWVLMGWVTAATAFGAAGWSVATYNVENYTLADRLVDGVYRKSYPKPERAKAALRRTLRELGAQVVVLQEVGGNAFLEELQRDLHLEGANYPHAALVEAADPDRRLALLSQERPLEIRTHTDLSVMYFGAREPVKRGLLEVTFMRPWGPVTLFAVHLKSRYTDRPDDPQSAVRRAAEATVLRDRILERCPNPSLRPFVVLGDFNDSRVARPIRAFLQRGALSITILLPASDSRGEVWTHRYAKEDSYSRVDHILVSPALYPWIEFGRATIADGADVAEASDHRPVVVRILDH
ncbi:MAG: endonuclease/exonuclease/phosphatase family protein [Opitutaceae bacterium]